VHVGRVSPSSDELSIAVQRHGRPASIYVLILHYTWMSCIQPRLHQEARWRRTTLVVLTCWTDESMMDDDRQIQCDASDSPRPHCRRELVSGKKLKTSVKCVDCGFLVELRPENLVGSR
jgi:hypothetical protein